MQWLLSLARIIGALLRALLDGWTALAALWRRLRPVLSKPKNPDRRVGRVTEQRCVPIREPAYKQPDPTIYSQTYLMALGSAVTWDNPDIVLRSNGADVSSHALMPDTEYEIVARIWNNSTEAPVVGLPVVLSFVDFGVGMSEHPIATTSVNLGVKGGPGHPAFASVKWRTPARPGHYCIKVFLDWFDDVNPNNNLGQENTIVAAAQSPAEFKFALRNATKERQAFRFEVDAYQLPATPDCPPERPLINDHNTARGPGAARRQVPPGHDRRNHPVPRGWAVAFEPNEPILTAGQETAIVARITPPATFRGRQSFNVNAFFGESLAGGVTVTVEAN